MSVRFLVKDTFQVTGRGTIVVGLIIEGDQIVPGTRFCDERTGASVKVRAVEIHTRQTPEGTQYGLVLNEPGGPRVEPGSILVEASPEPA